MPNLITHALCAQDALQEFKSEYLLGLIQKYPQVYSMASSGPDFIFYYRVYPWLDQSKCKEVYAVGNAIHAHHINAFYQKALGLIQNEVNPRHQEIMQVFIAGHILHWSLDTSAHPYVFFHTGEMRGATRYWHYRLESMIDTAMVQSIKGYQLSTMPSGQIVGSTLEVRKVISQFYADIVQDVYGDMLEPSVYEECLETMPKVAQLLFDPKNSKLKWIQSIENLMKAPWKFSSHMVLGELDTQHDVLNLEHLEWSHPCDKNEVSKESFVDLYEKAVLRGLGCLYTLDAIFRQQQKPEALTSLLQDRNYDTGKSNPSAMKFYRPIYKEN